MKRRIGSTLALTLFCLTLAGLPAMAAPSIVLFSNTGPGPSPAGVEISNPRTVVDMPWNCPFLDCDVTGVTFWTFNPEGQVTDFTHATWLVNPIAFNFRGTGNGTDPVLQIGPCLPMGGVEQCLDSITFEHPVDVPRGTNFLNLYNITSLNGGDVFWSSCGGRNSCPGGEGITLNRITGDITGNGTVAAFTVFGTPTIPEPSSILMLGSGMLGLAGVLRRKFRR